MGRCCVCVACEFAFAEFDSANAFAEFDSANAFAEFDSVKASAALIGRRDAR